MGREATVHWLGAGLSSVPGIRRLAAGPLPLVLWNRTLARAEQAVAGLEDRVTVRALDLETLERSLAAGDIVVSMLPGDWHLSIAERCLAQHCHFVCSSYMNDEMRALDGRARQRGLCMVNEVGLDPGLDHLMAHLLVQAYRGADEYDPGNTLYFRSYCGGFPCLPNDFRYKFSWSPLGVLKALRSPSRSIRDGAVREVARPWQAITDYEARLPGGRREVFEAYPNRDALPFMAQYRFDEDWQVAEFVRADPRFESFRAKVTALVEELLPAYEAEGKAYLAIGFGCTGGQHRSVAMAETLADRLAQNGWRVSTRHRELERRGTGMAVPAPSEE